MTYKRVLSRWLVAVYLLWSLPACNVPPPPPDQALLTLVQNTAEWSTDAFSYYQDPKLIDKIGDIHDVTNDAFNQVARIKFDFTGPQSTILSPFPNSTWPILDPTDPSNPSQATIEANRRFYATWVQNQRNATFAFGVFWVIGPPTNHPVVNGTAFCGPQAKVIGITLDDPFTDNEVPTNVTSRGSVMFAGWIYEVAKCSGYSGYPAINFYIRAHTHEMGHQRAGLTHADNSNFHTGPVPSPNQGRDVMQANMVGGDLSAKQPIFDQHYEQATEANPCLHLTCQDNLICGRSITN